MTDDPLNRLVEELARAMCLYEDPAQIGTNGSCEHGCIHPAQGSTCPYRSDVRATLNRLKSLNYAVVPVEATEEMVCGVVAKWDGRKFDPGMTLHEEISQDINAAIRAGNVIGGER